MADNQTVLAQIRENGASVFGVDIEVSGHHLKGDEPQAMGGGNTGPNPYDLLTAALGECTAMTVRWYAQRQKWPLEKVEVKVTHSKREVVGTSEIEGKAGKIDVFTKASMLHGTQLTQEQRDKLLDVAGKCPVQRTLMGNPVIRTTLLPA